MAKAHYSSLIFVYLAVQYLLALTEDSKALPYKDLPKIIKTIDFFLLELRIGSLAYSNLVIVGLTNILNAESYTSFNCD